MLPQGHGAAIVLVLAACASRPAPAPAPANQPSSGTDPAPAPSVPLTDAVQIEIEDAWSGLGCIHVFHASLVTDGDTAGGWHGEATLDAGRAGPSRRYVALLRPTIAQLERAIDDARAAIARADDEPADDEPAEVIAFSSWSDDYPSGAMRFTTATTSYRLAFTDQHRQLSLEHDGDSELLDVPQDSLERGSPLWTAYSDVLQALGLRAWLDEACATP